MPTFGWNGNTNNSGNTTTNWSPNGTPANGDSLDYISAVNFPMASFTGIGAHTFADVIFAAAFNKSIGLEGTPIEPSAITRLQFEAGGTAPSYIKATLPSVIVNSQNTAKPCLVLDGTITNLTITRGYVKILGTATLASGCIIVVDGDGELELETGITVAGPGTMLVNGNGRVYNSADLDGAQDIVATLPGGIVYLRDGGELPTPITISGGQLIHEGTGNHGKVVGTKGKYFIPPSGNVTKTCGPFVVSGPFELDLQHASKLTIPSSAGEKIQVLNSGSQFPIIRVPSGKRLTLSDT